MGRGRKRETSVCIWEIDPAIFECTAGAGYEYVQTSARGAKTATCAWSRFACCATVHRVATESSPTESWGACSSSGALFVEIGAETAEIWPEQAKGTLWRD